jgi:hypothetical protein
VGERGEDEVGVGDVQRQFVPRLPEHLLPREQDGRLGVHEETVEVENERFDRHSCTLAVCRNEYSVYRSSEILSGA